MAAYARLCKKLHLYNVLSFPLDALKLHECFKFQILIIIFDVIGFNIHKHLISMCVSRRHRFHLFHTVLLENMSCYSRNRPVRSTECLVHALQDEAKGTNGLTTYPEPGGSAPILCMRTRTSSLFIVVLVRLSLYNPGASWIETHTLLARGFRLKVLQ